MCIRDRSGGRPPGKDVRLLDVYHEKPVRVTAKVMVPVKEHPRVRRSKLFTLVKVVLNLSLPYSSTLLVNYWVPRATL